VVRPVFASSTAFSLQPHYGRYIMAGTHRPLLQRQRSRVAEVELRAGH
jgi:hypothetical protein